MLGGKLYDCPGDPQTYNPNRGTVNAMISPLLDTAELNYLLILMVNMEVAASTAESYILPHGKSREETQRYIRTNPHVIVISSHRKYHRK
jgi:hypothetical protein